MKEAIIATLIFIIIIIAFGATYGGTIKEVELNCRRNCESMEATFVRAEPGINGYTDACSCKKDGEIKPIW